MTKVLLALLFVTSAHAQTPSQLEAELTAHPDKIGTRMQLASLYSDQRNFDKAIDLLNAYTDQLPLEGFLTLANSYSNIKDYTNEIRILELLVAKREDDYRWRMLLSDAYLKSASVQTDAEKNRKLVTSAIEELRKVLKVQPKFKPAFDRLLATLLSNKLHNEARELLMEGIEKFGARAELYRDLCRLDSTDGFLVQSLGNCREAIRLAPAFPDSYVYLVQTLHDQKDDLQAEKVVVNAGKRFPKSEFVQWAAGTLFLRKKNFPVAGRYFKAALVADPKSNRAHYGLAQALFESEDSLGALEHYIMACASGEQAIIDSFLAAGGRLKQGANYRLGEKFVQKANTCRK